MGARKRTTAANRKEARKQQYIAQLRKCQMSPRKVRLVADLVRGKDADKALDILQYTDKAAAKPMEKLLKSAIANFEQKSGQRAEDAGLYIKTLTVDGGTMLKRIQPAPQGRAHRIRKRSNHITIELGAKNISKDIEEPTTDEIKETNPTEDKQTENTEKATKQS